MMEKEDIERLKNKGEAFVEDKIDEAKKSPKRAIVYIGFVVIAALVVVGVVAKLFS